MKFARKTDLIVIAALLTLSAALFALHRWSARGQTAVAEIYFDDRPVRRIVLRSGASETFPVPSRGSVALTVHPEGSISFAHSDCPDQICVHSGRLSLPGQSAACLPNRVIIRIVPLDGEPDDDMIIK